MTRTARATVRLATWNLQSCRRGFAGVSEHLRALDADVVALQEVDRGTARSGRVDQFAALANAGGYPHRAFFHARACDGGAYGLALLSRHPLHDVQTHVLPVATGLEPRVLGAASVEIQGRTLAIHVTHLSHRVTEGSVRARQVAFIRETMGRGTSNAVLMGDFNAAPGGPTHRSVRAWLGDAFESVGRGPSGTFPLPLPFSPAVRIDYVFTAPGVLAVDARVAPTRASDHHALVAEITPRNAQSQPQNTSLPAMWSQPPRHNSPLA